MAAVPDVVVTLEEQARQHRARAAAFTEARDLLLGLEDADAGDIIAVADWLITGDIDALLRRDEALHRRYLTTRNGWESPDAATWSPDLTAAGDEPVPAGRMRLRESSLWDQRGTEPGPLPDEVTRPDPAAG